MIELRPQPGPQEEYLASSADIVFYGGGAGGGKTWALLYDPLQYIVPSERWGPEGCKGFTGVIFRRTNPQIRNEGGLWDESEKLYELFDARPRESILEWVFPGGQTIRFAQLQHEKSKNEWQGAQIPFIGFDELTHFCVHPDTEVMTKDGWVKITEMQVGQQVASLTPDRKIAYAPATDVLSFDYHDDLVTLHQRNGLSYKVTPNHRMVVDTQREDGGWKFQRADYADDCHTLIPRTGTWVGEEQATMTLPLPTGQGHGPNSNSTAEVPMDDYLAFMGWYLSEGCAFENSKGTPIVAIKQTKEAGKIALRAVLDRLPWRYHEGTDGAFIIGSRQLYEHLKPLGNLYEKRIPRWMLALSPRQLRFFWDTFLLGDGSPTPSGGNLVGLANEGLVDDLQEVATLLGLVASKSFLIVKNQTGKSFPSWRLSVSCPERHATLVKPGQQQRERFDGKVWCLVVDPHHSFMMRYNGRCCWTGNTMEQFFYLSSRNRSGCGVTPYIRGTCNPDADSWVADFIAWWIDQDESSPTFGLAIPERAGVIRYFVRKSDVLHWADTPEELYHHFESYPPSIDRRTLVKSFTFIPASVFDNKKLLEINPEYLGTLEALPLVERERLLGMNWKIRPSSGNVFNKNWWKYCEAAPQGDIKWVRYWDKAATDTAEEKAYVARTPYTAGVLVGRTKAGVYYVVDVQREQYSPGKREEMIQTTALQDEEEYGDVTIWIEQEPGSGGKESAQLSSRKLSGFVVRTERVTGDKLGRAMPSSAQVEAGNVYLVKGPWNKAFVDELHGFPLARIKDQADAFGGAMNKLMRRRGVTGMLPPSQR